MGAHIWVINDSVEAFHVTDGRTPLQPEARFWAIKDVVP